MAGMVAVMMALMEALTAAKMAGMVMVCHETAGMVVASKELVGFPVVVVATRGVAAMANAMNPSFGLVYHHQSPKPDGSSIFSHIGDPNPILATERLDHTAAAAPKLHGGFGVV
ncbi:unnamed protein product [Ilex paraguariensis]|uniref:Uncharacterized protein n=1 Tax=Ilex paraguariensis TaxID=185542 RepID=A0ABC8T4F9_9AQUA